MNHGQPELGREAGLMTRWRGVLVGAFVLVGVLLFGGGLFLIGDRRLLFVRQFELNATFGRVSGLQSGTRVRLAGLPAGEVEEIAVPASPSGQFRVRMRLREDLRQLVRTDSVPSIQTDGIVGNAFIQINIGTEAAPVVQPGATLPGRDPIEFADLIDEGRTTFRTITGEVTELRGDVSQALQTLTVTAQAATGVISDVGQNVTTITSQSAEMIRKASQTLTQAQGMVTDVRAGRGTIGRLLTDDTLYQRMVGSSTQIEQVATNVRETTDRARELVTALAARGGTVEQLAVTLRNALTDVQEATADLAEGTEALKRNFLFRGFFRDRGFFDLDSVSREAYLAGTLARNRTPLRIWLEASVLFAADPATGDERLTVDGRRRIDSAMADLVRYPRNSPLVVEGYADAGGVDSPYLRSIDRAQLVRDYVLTRFRRQATLTDVMPMGETAVGSPSGDGRWSGIALTLFVDNEVLARTPAQ
jgi:phospholipid/cholesterol/gamma-HCH transport system substrate-binding protein